MSEQLQPTNESTINDKYIPLIRDDHRFLIIYGGAGSGKSYFIAQKLVLRLLENPNDVILCLRKVKTTLQMSVYQQMKDVIQAMNLSDYFWIRKAPLQIVCRFNNSKAIFFGVDDPEKLKSLSQINCIWCEEATELTWTDFMQINLRMRGQNENEKSIKQIILSFNPISTNHWIYSHFFGNAEKYTTENTHIVKCTYHDNYFLDENDVAALESLKDIDEQRYRVYCLAEWGVFEGTVYKYFNTFSDYPNFKPDETFYGLDFGYNNPTALLRIDIYDGFIYVTELIYQTEMTNQDLLNKMHLFRIKKSDFIYADTASKERIIDIQRKGYKCVPSIKEKSAGILTVKEKHSIILSHSNNINLHNEVQSYRYRKNPNGGYFDEPIKDDDHALDALRYALHTRYKHATKEQKITFY